MLEVATGASAHRVPQRCFAGVETRGDTLWLNLYWPTPLGELEFGLRHREHPLTMRVSGAGVRVSAGAGVRPPIRLCCRGEAVLLNPGETVVFPGT